MIELVDTTTTISSREIARLTGKRHSDILKDIRKLNNPETMNNLLIIYNCPAIIKEEKWKDCSGKEHPEFLLSYGVVIELLIKYASDCQRIIIIRETKCYKDIFTYINNLLDNKLTYRNKHSERLETLFYEEYLLNIFDKEDILREYKVLDGKYRIDFFIVSDNLAIEFDEKYHAVGSNPTKDNLRQKEIENALGCSFMRVSEDDFQKHIS